MPTILTAFGCDIPGEVRARSVLPALADDIDDGRVVATAIFGGPFAVTDGRYVMTHQPDDFFAPGLHEYTLAPQHMREQFTGKELKTAQLHPGFDFTKGIPVLKVDAQDDAKRVPLHDGQTFQDAKFTLYDLADDLQQMNPIRDVAVEDRLYRGLAELLASLDVPEETMRWYGFDRIGAFQ